jgi:hypothetical protein
MKAQLAAVEKVLRRVDPPLHAHLAAIDAVNCFFVFRSLLVLFRRDYPFDQVRPEPPRLHHSRLWRNQPPKN